MKLDGEQVGVVFEQFRATGEIVLPEGLDDKDQLLVFSQIREGLPHATYLAVEDQIAFLLQQEQAALQESDDFVGGDRLFGLRDDLRDGLMSETLYGIGGRVDKEQITAYLVTNIRMLAETLV